MGATCIIYVDAVGIPNGVADNRYLHSQIILVICPYLSRSLRLGKPGASAFRIPLMHSRSGWTNAVKWSDATHDSTKAYVDGGTGNRCVSSGDNRLRGARYMITKLYLYDSWILAGNAVVFGVSSRNAFVTVSSEKT